MAFAWSSAALSWQMQCLKDVYSLLLKRLIKLNTVAISVVRATSASSDIITSVERTRPEGTELAEKSILKN